MGIRPTQGQARLGHRHSALKTAVPGDPSVAGQIFGSPEVLELNDLSSLAYLGSAICDAILHKQLSDM